MGAWGYGYRDNDNYYNEAGIFARRMLESFQVEFGPKDLQDARAYLMWVFGLLRDTDEEVQLGPEEIQIIRDAVARIHIMAHDDASRWTEEFISVVDKELTLVEKWLDGFQEIEFLEDRMGAIVEAIEEKDSNGTET